MFAAMKYIKNVKTKKNKLNPFSPGITNVNDIPEKKRMIIVANIKNIFRDFPIRL